MSQTKQTYLLMLHGDEQRWAQADPDQIRAAYELHGRFSEQCTSRGHVILGGEELAPAATARVVRAVPGERPTVTDGPFAETAEQLGGYYLIETGDVDDLIAIIAPLVEGEGAAELRPVVRTVESEGADLQAAEAHA